MNDFQYESAIKAESTFASKWIITAIIGAVIGGIVGGLLLAAIIIFREGWFSLKALTLLGLVMGFIVGALTAFLAGRKSRIVGIIAVLGCGLAVIVGKYAMLYWYSRDVVASPLDMELMQYFISTPDLWSINDLGWFAASAFGAWVISSKPAAPTVTPAVSVTNKQ
jgi:hypothetical protein